MNRRKSICAIGMANQIQNKQLEESLTNEIDQNLRVIAFLHPFSESVKKLLVKDAFIKANKPAFHCVIHYLAMIISAVDFRKRFRWPLTIARDETEFRNAALTYFNDCNSHYKWNFGPIRMQVVLFPGGIEFMKIIVELTKTAMRTVLNENDSLHLITGNGMTLREANAKLQAAEEAYDEFQLFYNKISGLSVTIKERTCRLEKVLSNALDGTSITVKMLDDGFLKAWEHNQCKTIDEKIMPLEQDLKYFGSKCESLEEKITTSLCPQYLRIDKEKMNTLQLLQASEHFIPQINHDKLLVWLKSNITEMIDTIHVKPPWNASRLKVESKLLDKLLKRVNLLSDKTDAVIMDFPLGSNSISESNEMVLASKPIKYWYEKLAITPNLKEPVKKNARIVLWKSIPALYSPAKKIQTTSMALPDDTSGFGEGSSSADSVKLRTISTKLDPMSILSTAMRGNKGFNKTKESPRRASFISSLSGLDGDNLPPFNSTMISESPKSSTSLGNCSPLRKNLF